MKIFASSFGSIEPFTQKVSFIKLLSFTKYRESKFVHITLDLVLLALSHISQNNFFILLLNS